MKIGMCTENRPFLLKYSKYRTINRTEFCECSFLARLYYLEQKMLSCWTNVAVTDSLCITYYVLNKIHFYCLKADHQILPESEMEKALIELTLGIPSYDLLGINTAIPEKPLSQTNIRYKNYPNLWWA